MTIDLQQLRHDADRDGITKIVVGAVVHDPDGRVLILRRSPRDFMPGIEELPSGGVEPDEDLITALHRELAEEIGWTTDTQPAPDLDFVHSFDYVSASGRQARQLTFAMAHPGTPVRLSLEHTHYRWLRARDVSSTDITAETADTIRAWDVFRVGADQQ